MKIKKIHLDEFKRFTDLTIDNISETAKLVVLMDQMDAEKVLYLMPSKYGI